LKQLPNILTAARLLAAPYILYLLWTGEYRTALVWFSIASFTDVLDGFLARRLRVTSKIGALLDPVADKVLLSGSFLTLGLKGVIPFWLMAIVLGRDLLILGFAIVALARKIRREFPPSVWGKASTAAQIACVLFVVGHEAAITPLIVATLLGWIAAALTIWSGIDYFVKMSRRVS
jgi:cardiolipin synthase (CMP-forming)